METKLKLISKHVTENNDIKLTSIVHLINETSLKQAFHEIPKNRAVGNDDVTAEEYGNDLDYNIAKLVKRMKEGNYYPQPSKRVYIDKGNGKKRPLGLPSFEDKIVDRTMAKILNAIYEPLFLDCSYGFRPSLNAHQALKDLNDSINFKNVNYIIDADIKGFFDNVNKSKLKEMISHTIIDKNFNKLVSRFLQAGIVENGKHYKLDLGVPQGGLCKALHNPPYAK